MKKYKEYSPEVFRQAREKGLLDPKPKSKIIPEWIIQLADDYGQPIEIINKSVFKNKINGKNDRVVLFNNNFYSSSKLIHGQILLYLVANEGLNIDDPMKVIDWHEDLKLPVLGLHIGLNKKGEGIWLAESYKMKQVITLNKEIESNHNNYGKLINKLEKLTGLKYKGEPKLL